MNKLSERFYLFLFVTIAILTGHSVARYICVLAPLTPLTHFAALQFATLILLAHSFHGLAHLLRSLPHGTIEIHKRDSCRHWKHALTFASFAAFFGVFGTSPRGIFGFQFGAIAVSISLEARSSFARIVAVVQTDAVTFVIVLS